MSTQMAKQIAVQIAVNVQAIDELAPGIRQFTLARPDGAPLPAYSGGSHVVLGFTAGGRRHRNAYSLTGDPRQHQRYRIAVRAQADSRGGSRFLHQEAQPGMAFEITPPANLFPLARLARRHILMAGGIGVTPILAQAHDLARLGADFEVHYAYRSDDQAVYAEALADLAAMGAGRLHRYSDAAGQQLPFAQVLGSAPLGTHVYLCGPAGFIAAGQAAAQALGWPASHVHSERFTAPTGGTAFEAELASSGQRIAVPADLSLLEALEQAGLSPPQLCRGGACGQCETEVLAAEGTIEHRDVWLSAADKAAGRKIMPCVSRLNGPRLVLKL